MSVELNLETMEVEVRVARTIVKTEKIVIQIVKVDLKNRKNKRI